MAQGPIRSRWTRLALALGLAGFLGVVGGCGAHKVPSLAERFVRGTDGPVTVDLPGGSGQATAGGVELPADTPVPKANDQPTIETTAPSLREALAALEREPSPDALRRVAAEYHRLGVFDRAETYLTRALEARPQDAEIWDARARVWRDWGAPDRALADAHRATYLAPDSAAARNTFGTVLFALGRREEAAKSFTRALALDPTAAWAKSNLCFVAFVGGDEEAALGECASAIALDPALVVARNNLALVHAAAGRLDDAEREFTAAGPAGAGQYNFGMVCLARGEYARALRAFEAALREAPGLDAAFMRAQQTRALVARGAGGDGK